MNNSLAPGLLLASPALGDPNFDRTVVLLGEHDDEGSLGWVINGRPLVSPLELLRDARLLDAGAKAPRGVGGAGMVRYGGPVQPSSAWLLFEREGGQLAYPSSLLLGARYAITGAREAFVAVAAGQGPPRFRLLIGYAGWGPGQLGHEIQHGAWLPADLDDDLLFDLDVASLWDAAYQRSTGTSPAAFRSTSRGQA